MHRPHNSTRHGIELSRAVFPRLSRPVNALRVRRIQRLLSHWPRLVLLVILSTLVACKDEAPPTLLPPAELPASQPSEDQQTEQATPEVSGSKVVPASPTPIPPSPTPTEPLAALVNGQPIYLADFEKELARFEQAQQDLGISTDETGDEYTQVILDALIETELIMQQAEENGIAVTDEMVLERIEELKEAAGGIDNFAAWLDSNLWTEEEFQGALHKEMVTERMVNFVTSDVPFTLEQVRARYIQVNDPALAQELLQQVRDGEDFAALAQQYSLDRITGEDGGDLGFFAQGSLLVPEVEVTAFALEPGETSEVVEAPRADGSGTAYYLVQLIERDTQRQITANLRSMLLQEVFENWLAEQWNQATVERFIGENQ